MVYNIQVSTLNYGLALERSLGSPNKKPKYPKVDLKTQIIKLLHDLQKKGCTCCLKCSDYHVEAATSVGIYLRALGKDPETLRNNRSPIIGTGELSHEESPHDPRVSEHQFYFLQCVHSKDLERELRKIG